MVIKVLTYFGFIIWGYLLGNILVYTFNHLPGKWLVDYNEEPSEELLNPTVQRVKSVPYKYLFSCIYIFLSFMLYKYGIMYVIFGTISIWILSLIAISDKKYYIIPDELVLLLTITAIGAFPYMDSIKSMILGALFGFLVFFLIFLFSKFVLKKDGIGGGDIKLFTSIGLIIGLKGVIFCFILTTLLVFIFSIIGLISKKISFGTKLPMVPFTLLSYIIYLTFLRDFVLNISF